ncbi:hypothetical protein FOXG_21422 [Fusarium oxysporum f. sp. lycopersici 4287]|uniref:Uncharacterized protein n=1 Tax=Fusarium oxysporum f. sp. lycopersici (strain 4287 / CBS 123668 / FGSC 9935 / NRRL 34936) TaxID=426428 RepID=A0A0J9VSN2_FUSO4|nr:hypothetical protein FOXG_20875 [Fusarium oxysporum f. sp. lycopersici 4287]XP_018253696.1 hypothetical protein FOXG_21422 [Fusarium oxysporum f. sp. lycopersici 4287]KAJ9412924.1 hypothetical protein QL093DRAFT_2123553 [Fusarium oxysporum]KNB13670.1 hypothetical protein FOXG_20875 [Fusarium oxysporum f. sp. lycopersici 4287]KNB15651.1 hypothetical protein FOXG_21422 [Fusarium oxysporum f. sp. lycopersici 4287]
MSVQRFGKFYFKLEGNRANNARQNFGQPHIKDTYQTLNSNPDDIEEVSITDKSKRRERPSALNATDISHHSPKKTCNILGTDDSVQRVLRGDATSKTNGRIAARGISRDEPVELIASSTSIDATTYQPRHEESNTSFQQINEPDTAIVSTIPREEGRGDATQPGLTHIVKLALSLGTIEQLMERLEDAESLAKATETKIFEAKLVESNVKVKEETVESIFDTVLSSIQQLRVDGYQADSRGRRSQAKFKAWRSKVKEEAINLVLQEKHEEQEASRRSMERCKQKMKLLVDERERRERQVAVLRWCLVIRQLLNDLEKGVFGTEVEFLLNT